MPLTAGSRLGSYEVIAPIGAGGMGEVYRARDTTLNRDVAIKVLPAAFADDPDRVLRFKREAQVLASLNHQNIAHIHGLAESPHLMALVMELVEGDDLSSLIARGPLPIADALPIAQQIANALENAHEQGIVHRDLKPGNVKVRADGIVKVLDFGLAKALDPTAPAAVSEAMNSPTLTARATQLGMILGTAAYMAPEQAKGKPVDKRADIWAFGVVFYEMLTGRSPFVSDTIPETLAHVMTRDVGVDALPADTPRRIKRLIARCLVKDPSQRLRDIGDARLTLNDPDADESPRVIAPDAPPPLRRPWLWPVAAAVIAVAAAAAAWFVKPSPSSPTVRLSIALPAGEQVTTVPAISPDGRTIAYAAGKSPASSRLFVRRLDAFAAKAVDSGGSATYPFFSPDGRSIAFFANGKLWRAPVDGGAPTSLASAARPWGGAWGTDGRIVYVPTLNAGLWRVSADGGKPEQLSAPDDDDKGYAHVFPHMLPGGDILFSLWGRTFYSAVLTPGATTWRLATPESKRSSPAIHVEPGYMLLGDSSSNIRAATWSPAKAAVLPETVVIEHVNWIPGMEVPWLAVSASGTAVYVPGDPDGRHLIWVDRQGNVTPLPGDPEQITHASVSRDGHRIVHNGRESQWVRDLTTGTRMRIVTDLRSWNGGWLPDGDRIVISSNRTGNWELNTVRDTGGELTPLLTRPGTQHPLAVAPDGTVVFIENTPQTGMDIWKLSPTGEASPLVATPFIETSANVSWDGRYVAYVSDEAGRNDVYAIPFSGKGDRVMVSINGGTGPVWSRDGRELFYRSGDDLMSAQVKSTSPLVLGERRRLFDVSAFEPMYFHDFDVSADGQRFLFIRAAPESRPTRLDVIVNWQPELARLMK